jgi:DNA-binding MarR family transcriptional regulator
MIENGYLAHERSLHDRRSIRVRLTQNGRTLRDQLDGMYQRHLQRLGQNRITDADLQLVAATLRGLERFWRDLATLTDRDD